MTDDEHAKDIQAAADALARAVNAATDVGLSVHIEGIDSSVMGRGRSVLYLATVERHTRVHIAGPSRPFDR